MEENLKQLLLKDLCARLPYGVKVYDTFVDKTKILVGLNMVSNYATVKSESSLYNTHDIFIDDIKPYLRPMDSMTEEEINEFILISDTVLWLGNKMSTCILSLEQMDLLNKKMFDYRGLIEKNLAIEVTEENNPYKE